MKQLTLFFAIVVISFISCINKVDPQKHTVKILKLEENSGEFYCLKDKVSFKAGISNAHLFKVGSFGIIKCYQGTKVYNTLSLIGLILAFIAFICLLAKGL